MATAQAQFARITNEEYLAMERIAEERHEYLDGLIYAMAGESLDHGNICMNLGRLLSAHLLKSLCQTFAKDMKVRSGPVPEEAGSAKGFFSYPDLVVVCDKPQLYDDHLDVVLNPAIIIEVLSPSTEHFDRGKKWLRYQTWLPSLMDYLLVAQSQPLIEHYARQYDGGWRYTAAVGLEATIHLASINCTLALTDVYDRVRFKPDPVEEAAEEAPVEVDHDLL